MCNSHVLRGCDYNYIDKFTLAPQGLRRCKKCLVIRPIHAFWDKAGQRTMTCGNCLALIQRATRCPDRNIIGKRRRAETWRRKHPELFKARIGKWRKKNLTKLAESARRRRSKKNGNGVFLVTRGDYQRAWLRQDGRCYMCWRPLEKHAQIDHVIPIARGGRHAIGNLLWACRDCNRRKQARLLVEVKYNDFKGKLGIDARSELSLSY